MSKPAAPVDPKAAAPVEVKKERVFTKVVTSYADESAFIKKVGELFAEEKVKLPTQIEPLKAAPTIWNEPEPKPVFKLNKAQFWEILHSLFGVEIKEEEIKVIWEENIQKKPEKVDEFQFESNLKPYCLEHAFKKLAIK
jgi:hypothetical protein